MKINSIQRHLKLILVSMTFFLLVGCKTELYTGLTEQEANEMITVLQDAKLEVGKVSGLKGAVNLTVESQEIGKAVAILKKNGYPKDVFQSLGDVFKKDGLLSTPLEEKARYLYAVSQQISETLSNLDGVLTARVHVVLPTIDEVTKEITNFASASVFIKHYDEVDLKEYIPKIKLLVNNSIPSLEYDRITVLLFPSAGYQTIGEYRSDINDIYDPEGASKAERVSKFVKYILYSLIVIVAFNIGIMVFNRMSSGKSAPKLSDLLGNRGKGGEAGKKKGRREESTDTADSNDDDADSEANA